MQNDLISETTATNDREFMQRCLFLAQKGLGHTYPNPLVGCVIVHQGKIIAEGWHQKAGAPHAEAMAIANVENKALLKKSTLYVNLEPCAHFGKTPPCADLIVNHKIPKVIIATQDPHKVVAGKGIEKLTQAGCKVIVNVLHQEASFLNRRFFTYHQQKRPYVILKWAQTKDQFISPKSKTKRSVFWITETLAQQRVHQWRSEEQAILVGVQTVVEDNPQLTTRHWNGNHPLRYVVDPQGRIPKNTSLMTDALPTFILQEEANNAYPPNKTVLKTDFSNCHSLLNTLYENQIQSVIVEGGRKTLNHFLEEGVWDEIRVFENPKEIKEGIAAPNFVGTARKKENVGKDTLSIYFNEAFQK